MVMNYKKIEPYKFTEPELKKIWKEEYCKQEIKTFDNVLVEFYEDMFEHVFYESTDRKRKDKSILSLNRLEKIYWIKETLLDKNATLKKGWDSKEKRYFENRRVAIVKGNYIVIIRFYAYLKAKFVTAYEKNDIENVLKGPDFDKNSKYLKK